MKASFHIPNDPGGSLFIQVSMLAITSSWGDSSEVWDVMLCIVVD
jgi:hypothetical protein